MGLPRSITSACAAPSLGSTTAYRVSFQGVPLAGGVPVVIRYGRGPTALLPTEIGWPVVFQSLSSDTAYLPSPEAAQTRTYRALKSFPDKLRLCKWLLETVGNCPNVDQVVAPFGR